MYKKYEDSLFFGERLGTGIVRMRPFSWDPLGQPVLLVGRALRPELRVVPALDELLSKIIHDPSRKFRRVFVVCPLRVTHHFFQPELHEVGEMTMDSFR